MRSLVSGVVALALLVTASDAFAQCGGGGQCGANRNVPAAASAASSAGVVPQFQLQAFSLPAVSLDGGTSASATASTGASAFVPQMPAQTQVEVRYVPVPVGAQASAGSNGDGCASGQCGSAQTTTTSRSFAKTKSGHRPTPVANMAKAAARTAGALAKAAVPKPRGHRTVQVARSLSKTTTTGG